MSEVCSQCKQTVRQTHKETLVKGKLTMLQAAAKHVRSTMSNDFKVSDFTKPEDFKLFNNFSKLRYHGLVTPVSVGGVRQKGRWLITRNGWAFLRGEIELPQYVHVRDNHITSRADLLISVRDVYRGSDIIVTNFEYFDENNNPIGFRPTLGVASVFEQVGLHF